MGASDGPGIGGAGLQHLTAVDSSTVQWGASIRAVIVLAIPLAFAFETGYVVTGVFATIGALNVLIVQFGRTAADRLYNSVWAWGLNAAAIGLGTLVGTLGWLEVPLVAVGLIGIQFTDRVARGPAVLTVVSVMFVIGIGLPEPSVAAAGTRTLLALAGGGLAVAGLAAQMALVNLIGAINPDDHDAGTRFGLPGATPPDAIPPGLHAVAVGLTAAAALSVALALGFARDYWVLLTVVVVLRARFQESLETGTARMIGTVAGAGIGALAVETVHSAPAMAAILGASALTFFLLQRVNYTLYATALTIFVIGLINLYYPSGWALAGARIFDTFLGGSFALVAAAILWFYGRRSALRTGANPTT